MYHHDDGASQQLLLGGCFTAEQFSPLEKFSSLSFFFGIHKKKGKGRKRVHSCRIDKIERENQKSTSLSECN